MSNFLVIAISEERSQYSRLNTIPIYLCGSEKQKLSYLDRKAHAALHTGLAAVEIALNSAEEDADLLVPFTRRRSGSVLRFAQTKEGRSVISGAIGGYYSVGGWLPQGVPPIQQVFPNESRRFISGENTSLPECVR